MPNEFVARNGVIALNNSQITGSLTIGSGTSFSIQTTNKIIATADSSDANAPIIEGLAKSDGSGAIYIKNSTNTSFRAGFGIDSGGSLTYANYTTGGIVFYANSQYRMRLFGPTGNIVLKSVSDPTTYVDAGFRLDVDGTSRFIGNSQITGSLIVTAGITGSLFGTASWAQNAVTSSYILNAISASFASTASSVNTLNQNVIISGSLTVFTGSAIEFQVTNTGTKLGNLLTDIHSVTGSLNISGSENVRGSGSAVFTVDGTSGRLFSVDDSLSGSLFSVNTAAGLPVVEAFSDNTVRIGQYGQRALFVSQSRVGIGKETALNAVLDVSGSTIMTGSLTVGAFTSSFAGNVGINKTTPNSTLDVNGNTTITGSLTVNGTSAVIRSGANYGGTSFSNGSWGYARVGLTSGDPTISLVSNVQNATQTLDGITVPRTGSALLFSSTYGYDVGNEYQIISVGRLGVRVGNTTQALTIPTSGIVTVNQGLIVSGSLTTTGTITAQTLVVQTITSSVSFITGSTQFGSLLANTHQFTGSVSMTGSLNVIGGNVGIGTTSPSSSLEINKTAASTDGIGSSNNPAIRIKNTNSAAFNEKAEVQFTIGNSVLPTAAISNLYTSYTAGTQQGGDLVFSTRVAGSTLDERMRIIAAGNVGIGTTSPSELLDIAASADNVAVAGPKVNFKKGSTTKAVIGIGGNYLGQPTNTDDLIFRNDAGNILFGFSGTERMRINSNGNVGVGTTSPSNLFEVNGISAVVNSFGAFTALQASGSTGYRWTLANDASFRLQYTTNGFSGLAGTPLYVSSSGNIGIGTTSPTSLLHLKAASNPVIRLEGASDSGYVDFDGTRLLLSAGLGYMGFVTGTAEYMRLNGSGNLGIGTTSPLGKLEVSGDIRTTPDTFGYIRLGRWSSGYGGAALSTTGSATFLSVQVEDNEKMRITSAGRVGIGTTSPTATLTVSGSATINGNTSITGSLLVTGSDAFFNSVRVGRGFSSVATNTAVGVTAISGPTFAAVTGTKNVAVGYEALTLLKSGNDNTAVGYQSLLSGSIGSNNTAVGSSALFTNVSGSENTALGYAALGANTTGNLNTAVGSGALNANTIGNYNTAIGSNALAKTTVGSNTVLGYYAGSEITTGAGNTVIGAGNNVKPDNANLTTQTGILSLSSADQPEIWGQLVQVEVAPLDNATILSIDATVYAGAVVDYSLQDDAGAQRTSTMLIAFDCNANVNYTDPNPTEVGAGLGDYTFIPINNGTVDLLLTNNSGTQKCVVVLSCRLLKRYFGC